MARSVLTAEVSGKRTTIGWMVDVKVALGNRGMTVEAARQCTKDKKVSKEWREALSDCRVTVEAARNIGKSGEPWCIHV